MPSTVDYEGVLMEVLGPAEAETTPAEAARSARALAQLPPEIALSVSAPGVEPVPIPTTLVPMIAAILREIGEGHTVALLSTAEEVSTGVAARVLGVSRPHVAKLVDAGILRGRKVNRHRRVRMADVMALKREMDRQHALMDEMMELTEEMGLYESDRRR